MELTMQGLNAGQLAVLDMIDKRTATLTAQIGSAEAKIASMKAERDGLLEQRVLIVPPVPETPAEPETPAKAEKETAGSKK